MDRIDFERIIADLGEALGMDISFDDEGVCELVMRDSFGVSLKKSEEDGTLMMFSSLGADLPDPADYSLSPNRDIVNHAKLVQAFNEKYAASGKRLFFNQIDTYNALFSIVPTSFTPVNFAGTLEKIKSGNLELNSDVLTSDFDMEKANAQRDMGGLAGPVGGLAMGV